MAEREVLRAEKDYSEQLNKELPGIIELAKDGKTGLSTALEKLLALEKQTRQSSDLPSTSRILEAIVTLCRDAGDWNLMNEHVQLLAKKHAQLKLAITKMVQLVMTFIEQTPNEETKLSVIDTLRTVTEGKIFVEVERARVTRELSNIKKRKGDISSAKAVLCELQVETFGSMDRKEKTAFILEQIGLCIEDNDYTQGTILSRKISTRYFGAANKEDSEIMELKLRYYEQQIQIAKHDDKYLDACKHYRAVLDTPSIEKDDSLTKQTLERIIFYVILAPYDNEQSDLLHRIHGDNRLTKLVPEQASLLKLFTVSELMPWSRIEQTYGQLLRSTDVFRIDAPKGETRWQDLRKRVIEHNVRVIAKYYTKISMDRLRQLLDLEMQETEDYLSKLVVDKTISAKIDRPAKVVTFGTTRDADDVLNEWSGNMKSLLGLLERIDHLITKEEMMASIQPKAAKAAKGKAK